MSKATFAPRTFKAWSFRAGTLAGVGVVNNGPYTVEQQRLHVPCQVESNVWPVGTDRQLVFVPGSFAINVR